MDTVAIARDLSQKLQQIALEFAAARGLGATFAGSACHHAGTQLMLTENSWRAVVAWLRSETDDMEAAKPVLMAPGGRA